MEIFGQVFEIICTLLDGAKVRQADHCMDVLVKEGYIQKGSDEYYRLKDKLR